MHSFCRHLTINSSRPYKNIRDDQRLLIFAGLLPVSPINTMVDPGHCLTIMKSQCSNSDESKIAYNKISTSLLAELASRMPLTIFAPQ